MAYALNANSLKAITSYEAADHYFHSTPALKTMRKDDSYSEYKHTKWGGYEATKWNTTRWKENERPLNPNNPYLGYVRMIRNEGTSGVIYYAMRYHQTDVVTYGSDGTITICPYESLSTNAFVNRMSPFLADFVAHDIYALGVIEPDNVSPYRWQAKQRIYGIGGECTFVRGEDGRYVPANASDPHPWEWPKVDRKLAKLAMQGIDTAGLEAFLVMTLHHYRGKRTDRTLSHDDFIVVVREPARWIELASNTRYMRKLDSKHGSSWGRVDDNSPEGIARRFMRKLRIHMLRATGAIQFEQLPYLDGFQQLATLKKLRKQYETGGL